MDAMPTFRLHDLIPSLQIAVGPVILVSGVGLLLLSMTNRLGRVIDRARELTVELRAQSGDVARGTRQIEILMKRANALRQAITLSVISVLLAAVLVITIFLAAAFGLEAGLVVVILFIGSMTSLIGALIALLRDVNLSLAALKLEIG